MCLRRTINQVQYGFRIAIIICLFVCVTYACVTAQHVSPPSNNSLSARSALEESRHDVRNQRTSMSVKS